MRRGRTFSRRSSPGPVPLLGPVAVQVAAGGLPGRRRPRRLGALPDHQQPLRRPVGGAPAPLVWVAGASVLREAPEHPSQTGVSEYRGPSHPGLMDSAGVDRLARQPPRGAEDMRPSRGCDSLRKVQGQTRREFLCAGGIVSDRQDDARFSAQGVNRTEHSMLPDVRRVLRRMKSHPKTHSERGPVSSIQERNSFPHSRSKASHSALGWHSNEPDANLLSS